MAYGTVGSWYWDRNDLYFHSKLEFLEQLFGSKPLVLFQDELIKNPHSFIEKICVFLGADYEKEAINLKRKHTSYNEKQLKIRRLWSRSLNRKPYTPKKKYWIRKLQRYIRMPGRYLSLYLAYLVPSLWVSDEPLISMESMEKVRAYYEEDWKKCEEYARGSD